MNPFNRNLVFEVSAILLLTVSALEVLNMALVVLKNNFNRNIKIVCSAIFISEAKNKISYQTRFRVIPEKIRNLPNSERQSNPYRVNGKPIWTNICISTKTCPDEKLVWCRVNVA